MLVDGSVYGPGVGHVEPFAVEGYEVVAPVGKDPGQFQAQLSAGACQQDPHDGIPKGRRSGSLQALRCTRNSSA
jgi:hypothetical protein